MLQREEELEHSRREYRKLQQDLKQLQNEKAATEQAQQDLQIEMEQQLQKFHLQVGPASSSLPAHKVRPTLPQHVCGVVCLLFFLSMGVQGLAMRN